MNAAQIDGHSRNERTIDDMQEFRRQTTGHRPRPLIALAVSLVTGTVAWTSGVALAEPPSEVQPGSSTTLSDLIDATLPEFTLSGGAKLDEPLEIGARLRWDNNARGSENGLTVVYVLHGRPDAVVCVYPWNGRLVHDFGSMSRGHVVGRHKGETFWETDRPGVEFRTVPDAERPAESRPARLLQLKQLARMRFEGTLVGWKSDDSDRQELRLLPRPLYRYEPSVQGALDGAVFAFAMGVDPELLLLLEAVSDSDGAHWEYAFVRRTSGELQGRLDRSVVWTADRYPRGDNPRGLQRSVTRPLPEELLEPKSD